MNKPTSQVFQTHNPSRWQRVKWGFRVLGVLLALVVAVIVVAFYSMKKPDIPLEGKAIKKVLTEDQPEYRASEMGKRYRGFRRLIEDKWAKGKGTGQNNSVLELRLLCHSTKEMESSPWEQLGLGILLPSLRILLVIKLD